ncbi:MAG: alpha/beta hydrolase [Firmicutes bacterium]|nr:alpha/beta hydrolase [Bacillota bacterium]
MREEFMFDSCGKGKIHCCKWTPDTPPRAVVQIVHGIAEYVLRYDDFASYLNGLGFVVVAEDHMGHGGSMQPPVKGYFYGGWDAAVGDTHRLTERTKTEYPGLPYFLFGHSMGSFMTRTYLWQYPREELAGAVVCGTGWMPAAVLLPGIAVSKLVCRVTDETKPSNLLQLLAFGSYNRRIHPARTVVDWLNRDSEKVDAYIHDPLCGFRASSGLMRDMMGGMRRNQQRKNLQKMNRAVPIFFIAGGEDPVGSYGKGVHKAAEAFRKVGMERISEKLYPLDRHEILNEIDHDQVYQDVSRWLEEILGTAKPCAR